MNKFIDHTLLKNTATAKEINALCAEAKKYDFMSVCVNPANVRLAAQLLAGSDVKVCTVVGFPLGASSTQTKVFETIDAIGMGATEIDMVINVAKAKEGDFAFITEEIKAVVDASEDILVKVIIETCELSNIEIVKCSECVVEAGAEYVKTSTGFSSGGATVEHVKLMADTVKDKALVKASGGIRNLATAKAMIEAGANRLGCSAGVNIMNELQGEVIIDDSNATY